jgi:hypothetical protein
MKLRKQSLFSLALLTLLIIGTVSLINPAGSILTAEKVKWTPKTYDMANSANLQVMVKLFDADNNTLVEEIDNTTVTLEGAVPAMSTWIERNKHGKAESFNAVFKASLVKGLIWSILAHLDITRPRPWVPVPLPLTVQGELYDDTPWEGTEILLIANWAGEIPPPPPP